MDFIIKRNETKVEQASYFINAHDKLFQVIYAKEYGYALLDVSAGRIVSEFHEDTDQFIKYTTISDMTPVSQTKAAEFETI